MRTPLVLTFALVATVGAASGVPKQECFPLDTLKPELRARAEALLLEALDGEALYTLVGDIKPMSSGFSGAYLSLEKPDLAKVDELRQILATFKVGTEVYARFQPFLAVRDGKRYYEGLFFNANALKRTITEHQNFFGYFGLTPASDPVEAVLMVETDPTPKRNRGYGYLFGYPDAAVDFFVESEESFRVTKQFVPRDFRSIPTFSDEKHAFVYAVPKGSPETEVDRELKAKCAPILATYKRYREKYIGPGKAGVLALVRDWFSDRGGQYSTEAALRKCKL